MKKPLYKISFKTILDKQIKIDSGVITVTAVACTVTRKDFEREPEFSRRGYAYCSPSDIFDISVGRQLALKRAIGHFAKELRTKIWNAAFEGTFYLSG